MTSIATEATTAAILSSYDALSTSVGLAAVIALGILLFQREVTRIHRGETGARPERSFDVVLVPLLVVFFLVVSLRLVELVA